MQFMLIFHWNLCLVERKKYQKKFVFDTSMKVPSAKNKHHHETLIQPGKLFMYGKICLKPTSEP